MDTRKLFVKVSYGLIAALVLVLIGLLIYQQRSLRQVSDNDQQAPSTTTVSDSNTQAENNKQTTPVAEGGMEQLAEEVDTLRYQLEASEEELDMALEDLANERGSQDGDIKNLIAMEKKMRENPSVMSMRRRDEENFISQLYGTLFEGLGLTDDKIQDFKTLMVDYKMQLQETHLALLDQSLSEEKRKENMQLLEDQVAEFKNQARELLGAENYKAYDAYEERLTERSLVDGTVTSLSTDLGLSNEKEQGLIDAMYKARKKLEGEHGIDSSDITQILGSVNQNPEEAMDRQLEIFDRYIESARGVLSESQAEQFEARIKELQEMMVISMEFQ